jgi:hypothetical protein
MKETLKYQLPGLLTGVGELSLRVKGKERQVEERPHDGYKGDLEIGIRVISGSGERGF